MRSACTVRLGADSAWGPCISVHACCPRSYDMRCDACETCCVGSPSLFHTYHTAPQHGAPSFFLSCVGAFCCSAGAKVFVGLHLLVTRQEGVLYLKDTGVLVQEIASVRVSSFTSAQQQVDRDQSVRIEYGGR